MRTLMRLHRWAGVLACLAILAWSLSGVLHPVMSRLQPQPQLRTAPAVNLPARLDLPALLEAQGIDRVLAVHPVQAEGETWLRIAVPGRTDGLYLDAASGQPVTDGEARHARFLARHFSGEQQAAIRQPTPLTDFDDAYPRVNRLLPVWRVAFERPDALQVFVDTAHSRLGTLTDDRKLWMSRTFTALHSWQWATGQAWRLPLMTLLLLAALTTAVAGLIMALRLRHAGRRLQHRPLRRWHRRLALAVSLSALLFAGSGLYHLLHKAARPALPGTDLRQPVPVTALTHWPWLAAGETLSLHTVAGQPVWRIVPSPAAAGGPELDHHDHHDHDHHGTEDRNTIAAMPAGVRYVHAGDGQPVQAAEPRHAQALASAWAGLPESAIAETTAITAFDDEYGFLNKRLPVMRVRFSDRAATTVYVETATGELAAIIRNPDRLEGWSFAWLHKWHFLGLGKDARDALLALFALGNALVAGLGLGLFLRRRRTA